MCAHIGFCQISNCKFLCLRIASNILASLRKKCLLQCQRSRPMGSFLVCEFPQICYCKSQIFKRSATKTCVQYPVFTNRPGTQPVHRCSHCTVQDAHVNASPKATLSTNKPSLCLRNCIGTCMHIETQKVRQQVDVTGFPTKRERH